MSVFLKELGEWLTSHSTISWLQPNHSILQHTCVWIYLCFHAYSNFSAILGYLDQLSRQYNISRYMLNISQMKHISYTSDEWCRNWSRCTFSLIASASFCTNIKHMSPNWANMPGNGSSPIFFQDTKNLKIQDIYPSLFQLLNSVSTKKCAKRKC